MFEANIVLKGNAKPKFRKSYSIPFAMHDEVRSEIERLVSVNVLKPINASEWLRYRHRSQHSNADALSRLPVGDDNDFDLNECAMHDVHEINTISTSAVPLSAAVIAEHIEKDETLKIVKRIIIEGWPLRLNDSQQWLKPFFDRRFQLPYQDGVILLQTDYTRVVIPKDLQQNILKMLHDGHWGSTRMKQISRRYVWFPRIENAIENLCRSCTICLSSASQLKREFSSSPEATKPWERVHLDFAGPFCGSMWIILVDAFSKFPYVVKTKATTTDATVSTLKKIFVIEGLPQILVTDNGPQLTSSEFTNFCKLNHIELLKIAAFHPSSNGLAERFVRTFKESFTKNFRKTKNDEAALLKYLVTFRATPNPTTDKSPAGLLRGRQPRILFSALLPKEQHSSNRHAKFRLCQPVYARNSAGKERWLRGEIKEICGRLMYVIATSRYSIRRHQNQIRNATDENSPSNFRKQNEEGDWEVEVRASNSKSVEEPTTTPSKLSEVARGTVQTTDSPTPSNHVGEQQAQTTLRRSERNKNPVDRLRYSTL
ncbi:uncharacterized protein K02A2.6-like [Rhagoletis pomonella]|uniref:uncharacterized protein K02A2.6-like n=1 Tax=Rhagoletis pomonella TaxID=28610 RepID=UPI00177C7D75|nr:uncharacterized protein K02A2.6-like [Rhagoletis pomonella]